MASFVILLIACSYRHTDRQTDTQRHRDTHTHARTHARTHAHTHTHTQIDREEPIHLRGAKLKPAEEPYMPTLGRNRDGGPHCLRSGCSRKNSVPSSPFAERQVPARWRSPTCHTVAGSPLRMGASFTRAANGFAHGQRS